MQTAVEQIKDRLPITEVLSSYITLVPAGRQYKAKCPFHNERTPSFSVSPERGLYYCFGCGAKGDIFTFVQEFEGVDFNGALKILAERAGVELSSRDRRLDDTAPVYELLEKTTERYQNELQKRNDALLYLKGRGLTDETISEFRLGYAPQEWRFVTNTCNSEDERKIAERAGLIKKKEEIETKKEVPATPVSNSALSASGYYDRFRGRIMFPLDDASGRVVGFSGRVFPEADDGPKYLNSPETEVFQKSRVLYGFDHAKFHIKRHNFAILVEGQMDMVLSHQMGFRNTIATSGTAVSEQSAEDEHANLSVISRLTPNLFLAFDGDAAGHKAIGRAALVAIMLGMNPKVVPVPEGTDPADFLITEGPEKWKTLLSASEHYLLHQANILREKKLSPHALVQGLRAELFPLLAKVRSPIEQNLYIEGIGKALGIGAAELSRELALFVATQPATAERAVEERSAHPDDVSFRDRFAAFVERFDDPAIVAIKQATEAVTVDSHTIGALSIPEENRAALLAIIERDYGDLSDEEKIHAAKELSARVIEEFFSTIAYTLAETLRRAESDGDETAINHTLSLLATLNKRRHDTAP
ncbi:MAG TPA: DNA primase [Candidatus Paceibacterota bacterium]|nr:DNA primase [Candidatus Paceibacterota bacterium]